MNDKLYKNKRQTDRYVILLLTNKTTQQHKQEATVFLPVHKAPSLCIHLTNQIEVIAEHTIFSVTWHNLPTDTGAVGFADN
jgi:hypothetical protein